MGLVEMHVENNFMTYCTEITVVIKEFYIVNSTIDVWGLDPMTSSAPEVTFPKIKVYFTIDTHALEATFFDNQQEKMAYEVYRRIMDYPEVDVRHRNSSIVSKEIEKLVRQSFGLEPVHKFATGGWVPTKLEKPPLGPNPFTSHPPIPVASMVDPATEKMKDLIPDVMEGMDCPAMVDKECSRPRSTLWRIIQHLNDDHRWSRDRVADWLETLDLDLSFPVEAEDD